MIAMKDQDTDRAARTLADLGLVVRNGDGFTVTVPNVGREPADYTVRRLDDGRIACTCSVETDLDSDLRCVHMLAVRFAIKSKKSESLSKKKAPGNVVEISSARSQNTASRSDEPAASLKNICGALSLIDPNWSHSVKDLRLIGEEYVVTVAVTVNGVTREGIGCCREDKRSIEAAERSALAHAALKFALPRELRPDPVKLPVRAFPANPIARSLFDLVTAKQLGMIRATARELGMKADRECDRLMHCSTDELSKRAASAFIEHLTDLRIANSGGLRLAG